MELYDITVKNNKGEDVSLGRYKGQVLLIVNTATNCIFTPQYRALQALYGKFHDSGFEILDFPCNQFMNQAPGTDREIDRFCANEYFTSFPRFAKIDVNGKNASPLYRFLRSQPRGKGVFGSRIKWNFTKFLINREGEVIRRYAPGAKPDRIADDIEILL